MDSEKQKSGKELEMAEANNNEGEKEEEVTVNKSFYLKLLEKSQMWQELQVMYYLVGSCDGDYLISRGQMS